MTTNGLLASDLKEVQLEVVGAENLERRHGSGRRVHRLLEREGFKVVAGEFRASAHKGAQSVRAAVHSDSLICAY